MKMTLILAACLLGAAVNAAADSGLVLAGSQIEIIQPIQISLANKVKLDALPAPGVAFQRGTILQIQDITLEGLDHGVCVLMPNPEEDSQTFTIVPQVVTIQSVDKDTVALLSVFDASKKRHVMQLACECSFDQGPILTSRCLRSGFQRLSHASTLDLQPQLKLNAVDLIKTQIKTIRTN